MCQECVWSVYGESCEGRQAELRAQLWSLRNRLVPKTEHSVHLHKASGWEQRLLLLGFFPRRLCIWGRNLRWREVEQRWTRNWRKILMCGNKRCNVLKGMWEVTNQAKALKGFFLELCITFSVDKANSPDCFCVIILWYCTPRLVDLRMLSRKLSDTFRAFWVSTVLKEFQHKWQLFHLGFSELDFFFFWMAIVPFPELRPNKRNKHYSTQYDVRFQSA